MDPEQRARYAPGQGPEWRSRGVLGRASDARNLNLGSCRSPCSDRPVVGGRVEEMEAAILGVVGIDEGIRPCEEFACGGDRRPIHARRPTTHAIQHGDEQVGPILTAESAKCPQVVDARDGRDYGPLLVTRDVVGVHDRAGQPPVAVVEGVDLGNEKAANVPRWVGVVNDSRYCTTGSPPRPKRITAGDRGPSTADSVSVRPHRRPTATATGRGGVGVG